MNPNRLKKLKRALAAKSSKGSVNAREMEQIASQLGRQKVKRGKEPTWEHKELTSRPPLSIPHHGSTDLSPAVKRIVIDSLQKDIEAWEDRLGLGGYESGDDEEDHE